MARIARIVLPHTPHLISQRGNRGGRVFFCRADRQRYLDLLAGYLADNAVRLWAYRLDAAEVRAVVVPPDGEALGRTLRNAHGRYSRTINVRQDTVGHLFHGRFYSCPLDAEYLALAVRYVERFTGAVPPPTRNSAGAHCRGRTAGGILSDDLPLLKTVRHWRTWLARPIAPAALAHLLSRLRVGKPAGSPEFVARAEAFTGLNLSRPRGRPRTSK